MHSRGAARETVFSQARIPIREIRQMSDHRGPFERMLIGVDIHKYSARNLRRQDEIQRNLAGLLNQAATAARLDRTRWEISPTGDGEMAVLPAGADLVSGVR